tara:strand:- start:255 stop:476 length:222 start_codon:yes stop_codon:yes gene_type:complete
MEFAKEDGNTIQSRISTTIIEVVNEAIKQKRLPSSKKLSKKFYKYSNLNDGGYNLKLIQILQKIDQVVSKLPF